MGRLIKEGGLMLLKEVSGRDWRWLRRTALRRTNVRPRHATRAPWLTARYLLSLT
jgi:hypothetical protein